MPVTGRQASILIWVRWVEVGVGRFIVEVSLVPSSAGNGAIERGIRSVQ